MCICVCVICIWRHGTSEDIVEIMSQVAPLHRFREFTAGRQVCWTNALSTEQSPWSQKASLKKKHNRRTFQLRKQFKIETSKCLQILWWRHFQRNRLTRGELSETLAIDSQCLQWHDSLTGIPWRARYGGFKDSVWIKDTTGYPEMWCPSPLTQMPGLGPPEPFTPGIWE